MKNMVIPGGLFVTTFLLTVVVATPRVVYSQDAALAKKGEAVYVAQKCTTCHSVAGKGSKANPLDGVGKKLSAEEIRSWITNPTEMTKKSGSTKKPPMPNKWSKLPAEELDALVAYMQSLKK